MIKNKKYKALRIIWAIIGIFIVLWEIYWVLALRIFQSVDLISGLVLLVIGVYGFSIYIILTLIFILIKFIIKKLK